MDTWMGESRGLIVPLLSGFCHLLPCVRSRLHHHGLISQILRKLTLELSWELQVGPCDQP